MPNYGEYRRTNPRVRVLRGWPGNEPTHLTASAPVGIGVTIYSGQVIQLIPGTGLQSGQMVWALGIATAGQGTPYIAYHDSTDPDVSGSGKLLGLSCAGDYEIQTGWAVGLTGGNATAIAAGAATDYAYNSPVSAAAGGLVGPADAGAVLVGYVSARHPGYSGQTVATVTAPLRVGQGGLVDLAWPERVHVAGGPVIVGQSYNSESRPNNGDKVTVVTFVTRWNNSL